MMYAWIAFVSDSTTPEIPKWVYVGAESESHDQDSDPRQGLSQDCANNEYAKTGRIELPSMSIKHRGISLL